MSHISCEEWKDFKDSLYRATRCKIMESLQEGYCRRCGLRQISFYTGNESESDKGVL